MSLSGLLTAVAEYVGDTLANDCGRPVPTKVMRYHGTMPDACCSAEGVLSISWSTGFPSRTFPSRSSDPCVGPPVYMLELRYVTCWAGIDPHAEGLILPDDRWDADAGMLAEVADCVTRALMNLSCSPDTADPFTVAIYEHIFARQIQYVETTPIRPSGLCAGVTWKLYASVASGEAVS